MQRFISLAMVVATLSATAQQEEPIDTLLISNGPSSAIITENAHGLKVTVRNLDEDNAAESTYIQDYAPNASVSSRQSTSRWTSLATMDCVLGLKTTRHWEVISSGLGFGMVNAAGQPADLGLQWNKSFEISWVNALAIRYYTAWQSVSLGLGFDWRNYKITTTGHRLCANGEGGIGIAPYPDGSSKKASRIKVFSLGIPLLYTQKIPKTTLSLTIGGILNFNTHASLKTWYTNSEGNKAEEYTDDINPRRITVDLFGSINIYQGNGIYIRYSPNNVLQGHNSPEFRPLSVGLILFL